MVTIVPREIAAARSERRRRDDVTAATNAPA